MKFTDIKLAKRILLNKSPFIACLIFKLEMKVDNSEQNPTACTDGKSILFNENFLDTLNLEELVTLLAHEVLHVSLCHHLRMDGKDRDRWNIATDHAINLLLLKMGFTALKNWLCDPKYRNMSAEQIYLTLPEKPSEEEKKAAETGQFKQPENMTSEEKAEAKDNAKAELQRAIDTQKKAEKSIQTSNIPQSQKEIQLDEMGKSIKSFEEAIKEFNQSQTDWREILQQFISSHSYNDYSYSVPNRYNSTDFFQPGLYQSEPGNITLALDVSGSTAKIAKKIANEAFSALQIIHEAEEPVMNVIYCSDHIHYDETISSQDELRFVKGGGTRFSPVMERMRDKDTQALIYVTDGLCWDFGEEPSQPVLWAIIGTNTRFKPPFGEIIYIN